MDLFWAYMAAGVCAGGFIGLAGFQLMLALGFPLGHAAWGGKRAVLLKKQRTASSVVAVLLALSALMVLIKIHLIAGPAFIAGFVWLPFFGLAASALANLASRSRLERMVMAPISVLLAVCCFVVATSP